jgi:hypothetical protein
VPVACRTRVAQIVESNKKQSIAKMGAISPIDVTVPKGTTGLEPTQTAFFQACNSATCDMQRSRGNIQRGLTAPASSRRGPPFV